MGRAVVEAGGIPIPTKLRHGEQSSIFGYTYIYYIQIYITNVIFFKLTLLYILKTLSVNL